MFNYIHFIKKFVKNMIPDYLFLKREFRLHVGYPLNLRDPQTFGEKLQWLKLYNRNPLYTKLVDKYAVKKWVADKIGEKYIIPTLGVWKKFDDIVFDNLPNQFVLKCTHDSRGLVICKDKLTLDVVTARKKLKKALKYNFYYDGREWPYKNVSPHIIAEKYIEDELGELTDYKFFCFDGVPQYCQVIRGRCTQETIDFYDMDWNHMPFVGLTRGVKNGLRPISKPKKFDDMVGICEKLSSGIPFVRVDLYNINGTILFGELTFYPACGFGVFEPNEWNYSIGKLLKLPQNKT